MSGEINWLPEDVNWLSNLFMHYFGGLEEAVERGGNGELQEWWYNTIGDTVSDAVDTPLFRLYARDWYESDEDAGFEFSIYRDESAYPDVEPGSLPGLGFIEWFVENTDLSELRVLAEGSEDLDQETFRDFFRSRAEDRAIQRISGVAISDGESEDERFNCMSSELSDDWLQTVTGRDDAEREQLCEAFAELLGENCGICGEALFDGRELAVLPCDHIFHARELDEYAGDSSECPECGERFSV